MTCAGPLSGTLVLDLSRVLAGPWATQTLGDLGADVIKVERPGAGDDTRAWGPPFAESGDAAYFTAANRNKSSIAVDMAKPEGAALLRGLAAKADVLVENFKVGGLKKYGLDHDSLRTLNPRLIYCSITGFGQTGPYAPRAGYDYMIQAMGGLMSITGAADEAGGEPMKVGVAVADLFTGLYAANAILAALLHARATGQGQHLDIALFDCQAAMLANQASNYFVSGQPPGRLGNAHPNLAPYQPFPASDGAVVIAVGNDGQFRALCETLGASDLPADPRFERNRDRVANRQALAEALSLHTRLKPMRFWLEALEAAGVPAGPINTIDQVFEDPQAQARALVVDQQGVKSVASPLRLSATPVSYRLPPPALGADTAAILRRQLGLDVETLQRLSQAGVIGG